MRSMDVYISKLRKLLFDYTYSEIINVHGVGFKLITHRDAEFRKELRRDAGKLRKFPIRHHRGMPLTVATSHERLEAEVMEAVLREPDEMLRKVEVEPTAKDAGAAMPDTAAPKEATPSDATDLPADAMGATPEAGV